jgi:hypothetical protein
MKPQILVIAFGVLLSGAALADCPVSLSVQETTDCIVAEGAGQSYESYLKEMKELEKEIIASEAAKSPCNQETLASSNMTQ